MDNKTLNFIHKANNIHNNKYDYSKTIYTTNRNKVIIICKIHNLEFTQVACDHTRIRNTPVRGKYLNSNGGCPSCRIDKLRQSQTYSKEQFIAKAKTIHGDKYDYSKTTPTHSNNYIIVTCPYHGDFNIQQRRHCDINQSLGCSECGNLFKKFSMYSQEKATYDDYEFAKDIPCIFYIIKINNFYKVGITTKTIEKRYRKKIKYEIIQEVYTTVFNAIIFENYILSYIKENKLSYYAGIELSKVGGATECYKLQ